MKYENRNEAFDICEQIKKYQKLLDDLDNDNLHTEICTYGSVMLYSANIVRKQDISGVDYSLAARNYYDSVVSITKKHIEDLKEKLNKL